MLLVALLAVAAMLVAACAPAARQSGPPDGAAIRPTPTPSTVAPDRTAGSYVTAGTRPSIAGCELFPRDHVSRAYIRSLPVRSDSAAVMAAAGPTRPIKAGFGSKIWQGSRPGIPVNVVDGSTSDWQRLLLSHLYANSSDGEWMPWPENPRFEGWPGSAWDRHMIVVDSDTCLSWEAIQVQPPWENIWAGLLGRWWADKLVAIDLSSNMPRKGGTVNASGFSMLPGLISYDDVASGEIDYVLGMSFPEIRANETVWPAMRTDGRSTNKAAPQMGSWLRLKPTADLSRLGPQSRVIARALQDHGVIIGDTGPSAAIGGQPDTRWDEADLAGLGSFTLADFELVDPSPMKVSDSSHQIR
jgi:hypothetical protein